MPDAPAAILARMRALQSQGRAPELTAGDVAVLLGTSEAGAARALRPMVQTGALRSDQPSRTLPTIYRLPDA